MLGRSLPLLFPSFVLAVAGAGIARAADPFDEAVLSATLWERSPMLADRRQDVVSARTYSERARLLPNPELSLGWGTIPLGPRNPPELAFSSIPNYSLGVSQLIELGKRGPRREAAEGSLRATQAGLREAHRQVFFDLLEAISAQAAAVARLAALEALVASSAESLRVQQARATRGDLAALEADRLEVEHLRLVAAAGQAKAERDEALAACSVLLGGHCPAFPGPEQARHFLARGRQPLPALGRADLAGRRPDLQTLAAAGAALAAERRLAERQLIPDPRISLSYTRDQFVVSGNQPHTLTLGLSLPLPVFDRGQADAARAQRSRGLALDAAETTLAGALDALAVARRRWETLGLRERVLEIEALPKARAVNERVAAAAARGGAALPDLLLARRALEEIELESLEVMADRNAAWLAVRRIAALLPAPAGAPPAPPDSQAPPLPVRQPNQDDRSPS